MHKISMMFVHKTWLKDFNNFLSEDVKKEQMLEISKFKMLKLKMLMLKISILKISILKILMMKILMTKISMMTKKCPWVYLNRNGKNMKD